MGKQVAAGLLKKKISLVSGKQEPQGKCRYAKSEICHPAAALLIHLPKQTLRKASFPRDMFPQMCTCL